MLSTLSTILLLSIRRLIGNLIDILTIVLIRILRRGVVAVVIVPVLVIVIFLCSEVNILLLQLMKALAF